MKKKIALLLAAAVLGLTLCACGGEKETSKNDSAAQEVLAKPQEVREETVETTVETVEYTEGVPENSFMYAEYMEAVKETFGFYEEMQAYSNQTIAKSLYSKVDTSTITQMSTESIIDAYKEPYLTILERIVELCGDRTYFNLPGVKAAAEVLIEKVNSIEPDEAGRAFLLGTDHELTDNLSAEWDKTDTEIQRDYPFMDILLEISYMEEMDYELVKEYLVDLPGRPLDSFYTTQGSSAPAAPEKEPENTPAPAAPEKEPENIPAESDDSGAKSAVDTSAIEGTYNDGFLFCDGTNSSASAEVKEGVLSIIQNGNVVVKGTVIGMHSLSDWGYHYDLEMVDGGKGMILYDYGGSEGEIQYYLLDSNGDQDMNNCGVFYN